MSEIRNRATLDATQFQAGLKAMEGGVKGLGASLKAIPGIGSALGGIGLAAMVGDAMKAADEIDNLAGQTKLSIMAVQSLSVVAKDAGLSFEQVGAAVRKVQSAINRANAGNKDASASFEALGLSAAVLGKMNTDQALEAVAKAMFENEGSATASAAATKILGEESGRLNGILKILADEGFANLNKRLLDSGQIMETATIKMLDRAEQQATRLGRTVKTVGATAAGSFFMGANAIGMMAGALSEGLTPAQAWQMVLDDMQGSAAGAVNSISDLADETARLAREQAASLSAFQELEGILFNQQMELLSTTEQLEHYEQVLANLAQQKVESFFGDDNEEQLRIIKEMERVQARINRLKAQQESATTKEEAEAMSEAEAAEKLSNTQARREAGGGVELWHQVLKERDVAKAEYEAAQSAKERLAAYEKMARLDDEQERIWEGLRSRNDDPDPIESNDASWFRKVGGAAGGNVLGSPVETRREKQFADMARALNAVDRATREQTEILRTISNQDGSARL